MTLFLIDSSPPFSQTSISLSRPGRRLASVTVAARLHAGVAVAAKVYRKNGLGQRYCTVTVTSLFGASAGDSIAPPSGMRSAYGRALVRLRQARRGRDQREIGSTFCGSSGLGRHWLAASCFHVPGFRDGP